MEFPEILSQNPSVSGNSKIMHCGIHINMPYYIIIVHYCSELEEIGDQLEAVRESRNMLTRMKTCLRNMKDAMAGIESLTLTVCDLGMDDYVKQ